MKKCHLNCICANLCQFSGFQVICCENLADCQSVHVVPIVIDSRHPYKRLKLSDRPASLEKVEASRSTSRRHPTRLQLLLMVWIFQSFSRSYLITFYSHSLHRTIATISRPNFAAIFPGRCILLWEFIADILISIAFCNIPGRILQQFLGWTLQNFPRSSFATFADRIC